MVHTTLASFALRAGSVAHYAQQPEHLQRRRATKHKYIGVLTGVEDASNDPELTATVERGSLLLETIAQHIAERAQALLSEVAGSR
jgi:hypothetical protein